MAGIVSDSTANPALDIGIALVYRRFGSQPRGQKTATKAPVLNQT
jgi:glycerol uptake facilitator-like aquaporin